MASKSARERSGQYYRPNTMADLRREIGVPAPTKSNHPAVVQPVGDGVNFRAACQCGWQSRPYHWERDATGAAERHGLSYTA